MVRAARSSSGIAVPRGTEVVVLRAEGGVGIVAPWDELYGDDPLPEIPPHEPISGNGSHPGATSVLETGAPATLRKNSDGTNE
jgi:hypothetical protein